MIAYEFRLDSNGTAHVTRPGFNTAECGKETKRPAPTQGRPCQHCLDVVSRREAGVPSVDVSSCFLQIVK